MLQENSNLLDNQSNSSESEDELMDRSKMIKTALYTVNGDKAEEDIYFDDNDFESHAPVTKFTPLQQ